MFIRNFLFVRNFAKKFSSINFESCLLGVKFFIVFLADLGASIRLLKYVDSLSSAYNSDIVRLCIFCLASTPKNV